MLHISIAWAALRARGVIIRAGICLVAYVVAFIAVVTYPFPGRWQSYTVTTAAIELLELPWPTGRVGCDLCQNQGILRTYFEVASLLTIMVVQPILTYQVFALASVPPIKRIRICLSAIACFVSFTIGVLFSYAIVLPVAFHLLISWTPNYLGRKQIFSGYLGSDLTWELSFYLRKTSMLLFLLGLICALPAFLAGLVWLGILPEPVRPGRPQPD